MAFQLFNLPPQQPLSAAGRVLPGAKLSFFLTTTSTPTPVYTTSALNVAHTQPLIADAGGRFESVYLDPTIVYKATVTDANDVLLYTVDPVNDQILSQAILGSILFPQTAGEAADGLTPTNYSYQPGDIRRYGATSGDITSIVQSALDANSSVFIPDGNWTISSPGVKMNDYNVLRFESRNAKFVADFGGAIIGGKNTDTGTLTDDENRIHWQVHGGYIDGTDRTNAGSIGIDLRGAKMCKVFGTYIQNVEKGVRGSGDEGVGISSGCYYNDLFGVDIQTVVYGYWFSQFANDNHIFGGRVNDCTTGTWDDNNSSNVYFGLAVEVFTTGHEVAENNATQNIRFVCSRLENLPTSGTGIVINALAQDTWVYGPHIAGLTTTIDDSGIRSNISSSEHFTLGATRFKKITRVVVNQAVATIAAGVTRQDGFTIPNLAAGDRISVTLPNAWPSGLISTPPIVATGNAFLQLHNPTGGDISMSAADFVFEWVDYT